MCDGPIDLDSGVTIEAGRRGKAIRNKRCGRAKCRTRGGRGSLCQTLADGAGFQNNHRRVLTTAAQPHQRATPRAQQRPPASPSPSWRPSASQRMGEGREDDPLRPKRPRRSKLRRRSSGSTGRQCVPGIALAIPRCAQRLGRLALSITAQLRTGGKATTQSLAEKWWPSCA